MSAITSPVLSPKIPLAELDSARAPRGNADNTASQRDPSSSRSPSSRSCHPERSEGSASVSPLEAAGGRYFFAGAFPPSAGLRSNLPLLWAQNRHSGVLSQA